MVVGSLGKEFPTKPSEHRIRRSSAQENVQKWWPIDVTRTNYMFEMPYVR